ncbi:TetR/AcrR family transcriptional regulator [Maricurvus nonylphenolicus]|uniref:TetR/AcrR family transcriptional regulator n=1 Tax=Maricurvus nonylphenolicus TaxID=1008307 RepID=UPI0036F36C88
MSHIEQPATPEPSRKQKQIDNSRQWIVEAYYQLLESGSGNVTVTDICKRAGVGRQTFYRHFENTEAVLHFETERVFRLFLDIVYDLDPEQRSHREIHRQAFLAFRNNAERVRLLQPLISPEWFAARFIHYRMEIEKHFMAFHSEDDYDFLYRAGGMAAVFMSWLKRGMQEEPEEMVEQLDGIAH